MGLDAADVVLASGAMAASPLFCRGCREMQLSFSRIGGDARPVAPRLQSYALQPATQWRLQPTKCTQPVPPYPFQATRAARASPRRWVRWVC